MSAASATFARGNTRAAPGSSATSQAEAELLPAADTLWGDVYHVIAELPGSTPAVQWWRAHRTDTAEEVFLRVTADAGDTLRSAAWKRLCALELPHLQRARECHTVTAHRVEIYSAVRGQPLGDWHRAQTTVSVPAIETMVKQLTEALGVLHASGLVHLGLKPDAIFVHEEKGALHCTLAGLDRVTRFEHHQPIPAPADPFYAPPEAVNLDAHEPGPALCAWDWWSLGRIAQELVLGRHVVDCLPDANPGEAAVERQGRAEGLMLERAAKGLRAGAVEVMISLDARLKPLLRGLLASAPEVRWAGEAVDRWVRQLPVKEHYETARVEKKFRWRGRLWAVAEAAKELQTAERWAEAVPQIFGAGQPGTLAHFIAKAPEQKNVAAQLAELVKLTGEEPLRTLPEPLARELVAAIALLMIAGGNFLWRGRRLDGGSLASLLTADPESFALVRALTHRTVTGQIERHDFGTSRSLAQVGRCAADAEAIIRRHGWLKEADAAATERIFRLALEAEATLLAARERLQRTYACAALPAVEKSFKLAKPAHVELVVLAWAEPAAAECGFVTHAAWEAQQLQQLQERSRSIVAGLCWVQFARARAAGPVIFGPWLAVVAGWGVAVLALAYVFPGPRWLAVAVAPALVALGIRTGFTVGPAAVLRQFAPGAARWKWTDGTARCEAEWLAAGKGLDGAGLTRALAEINVEISKLKVLQPQPAPVAAPPQFGGMRIAGLAGWILLAGLAAGVAWRGRVQPPTWHGFRLAWDPALAAEAAAEVKAATALAAAAETKFAAPLKSESAVVPDVKVSWPFHRTDDVTALAATETLEPTKAQTAYAMQRGRAIAAPYRVETINSLVVFEVPAGGKTGVMIFDGAHDALAVPKVFILDYRAPARAWVELAGKVGVVVPE
jgi:hypothetical protein